MAMFKNVNVAPIDTSGFERAGAAYGQMFQNLGNTIADTIEKHQKKKAITGYIENAPPEVLKAMGVSDPSDPDQVKIAVNTLNKGGQPAWNMIQLGASIQQQQRKAAAQAAAATQAQVNWEKGYGIQKTASDIAKEESTYGKTQRQVSEEKDKLKNEQLRQAIEINQAQEGRDVEGEKREVDEFGYKVKGRPDQEKLTQLEIEQKELGIYTGVAAENRAQQLFPNEQTASDQKIAEGKLRIEKMESDRAIVAQQLLTADEIQALQAKLEDMGIESKLNIQPGPEGKYRVTGVDEITTYTPATVKEINELQEAEIELESNPDDERLQQRVRYLRTIVERHEAAANMWSFLMQNQSGGTAPSLGQTPGE